ncbi:MAG: shikimate kinase [Planctomycetes bacterium]|jgi:shikimate kinase|nr:shikimate kinase [Planctomycetota bacterium]MDA8378205.1 shikimate kinase [Planctomycetia bacterium]
MNIVLIGYRGAGKTTIGKQLAGRMGMEFIDTDDSIVQRAGKSIREIFAEGGETLFRDLESAVIDDLVETDNTVIAAGGGVVLRKTNIEKLQANGRIVWLQAPAEVLWKRLQSDTRTPANRPDLTSTGGLEEILRLLQVRAPLYSTAADVALDVTNMSEDQIVRYLAEMA